MTEQYFPDDHVPSTFNVGMVAASYFASLCGCILTVEILHHRGTAVRNLRSWLETLACATSMALVGIWCMHFIGNRAIVLGNGDPQVQLVYGSGFTVLSVILPIIGLMVAFCLAEIPLGTSWKHWTALTSTGVFAGLSIVSMHYVGNIGVANYSLAYSTRYMAASFTIAVSDCLAVLILFYKLREKWISAWWKRTCCAMALAGGVSAMHFTASTNCDYTLRRYTTDGEMKARNVQVIVASTLCAVAGLVVLLFLFIARKKSRQLKRRSRKVMLASAIFNPSGQILVTTDGVLPSREITDKYNHRTFDEEFDTAHPVYQWIFRVTRNWSAVTALIPSMKSHLHAQNMSLDESNPSSSQSSAIYDAETYSNYDILFKERFCVAANAIAALLKVNLDQIGVLYDKVIETGTLQADDKASRRNTTIMGRTPSEIEASLRYSIFGNGQLLFTTKEVTLAEANHLLEVGLRFASVQHVGRTISHAFQIPLEDTEKYLSGLKRYVENLQSTEKSGTWLAFFAMIPKLHGKGFDVAVKQSRQDQLPDVQLLPDQPLPWQISFLDRYDGLTVKRILNKLDDRTGKERLQPHESQFATVLREAIAQLILPFPQEWVRDARFWSRQVFAHYSESRQDRSIVTPMYTFTVIGDMHATIDTSHSITRVPKSFFEARHRCYAGSPDHAELQQRIYTNFTPLYRNKMQKSGQHKKLSLAMSGKGDLIGKLKKQNTNSHPSSRGSLTGYTDESSSAHELVDTAYHASENYPDNENQRVKGLGGILVNSETVVNTDGKEGYGSGKPENDLLMGRTANITTAKPEVIFVNELANVTKERFLPALKGSV